MTTFALGFAVVLIVAVALLASRRTKVAKMSSERARWSVSVGPSVGGTRAVVLLRSDDGTAVKLRRMTLLEPAGAEMALTNGSEKLGSFASAIDVGKIVSARQNGSRQVALDALLRMPAWSLQNGGHGFRLKLSLDVDVNLKDLPGIQVIVTSPDICEAGPP